MLVLTITGLLMEICFVGMAFLQDLSEHMISFLGIFGIAGLSYGAAVFWMLVQGKGEPRGSLCSIGREAQRLLCPVRKEAQRLLCPVRREAQRLLCPVRREAQRLLRALCGADGERTLSLIWVLAILFRVTVLFTTPPTLSSDVYRYIWDGRMMNAGVNPYAHVVDSPLLDRFDSPQRSLVNHSWMASPYLPAAQVFFAAVYRLGPESPLAFQIAAVLLDLLTGWLVADVLRRLGLPRARALIYLWNPLVVVEFAHGAHVDALMICLMMGVFWSLVVRASVARRSRPRRPASAVSVVTLAAATLTKGLPILLLPIVARRLGWRKTMVTLGLVIAACVPFALGAGWGLAGPLDGEGLFGALRIYTVYWRFNAGLYHWLEAGLSWCWSRGAVTLDVAGWEPDVAARLITLCVLGWVVIAVWRVGRMMNIGGRLSDGLALLRLAIIPLAAHLLLATTIHPWYVTVLIPLLPFLLPRKGEANRAGRWLLPGLYFSVIVSLSYFTYLDPANPHENSLVRLIEYVPLYSLLTWSACGSLLDAPASGGSASFTGW